MINTIREIFRTWLDGQDEEEIVGWKILSLQATSHGQDLNRIDLIM